MDINENDDQQGGKKEEIKGQDQRKSEPVVQGQGKEGHAEFHNRVLQRDRNLAGSAFPPQDKIAENRDVLVPVQVGSAFGAVRGRKNHGLGLIRQPEDDDIEERADQGTENKAVEKINCFHSSTGWLLI